MSTRRPARDPRIGFPPGVPPAFPHLTPVLDLNPAAPAGIKGKSKITITRQARFYAALACFVCFLAQSSPAAEPFFAVLNPAAFAHHIERFNAMEPETVVNHVPNAEAWPWLQKNIPLFECPDREVEEIYHFRWWSFRKHLKQTPKGFVITEFLTPVSHAGEFNTISCAAGFHLAEGRWIRDDRYLDDYTRFWLRGADGKPQPHFHQFSSWFAAATYDRYLVSGDRQFILDLLPDLVADYRAWEKERQLPDGLFWQYDVADGMEESLSGSRTAKHIRPTINSYMFANALAIAEIAQLAGRADVSVEFADKARSLKWLVENSLWDAEARFFKTRIPATASAPSVLSDVREAIGYVPWMFGLPEPTPESSSAFAQLTDPRGFAAPFGLTTAERRHPRFRSHGIGTCEWDGAVWPFATSQTLYALANYLRASDASSDITQHASRSTFFDAFLTYTRSQYADGKPFIGEYLDEVTGAWINRRDRSAYYNHSTYADLLITGVVGLRPRADDTVEVQPLLPPETWNWFCLDGVKYHGRTLTIFWDKDGSRYGRGPGLQVLADGKLIARTSPLERITGRLP